MNDKPEYTLSSESAIEDAKKSSSVIVLPKPNQLFIDIDSKDDILLHLQFLDIVLQRYGALESILTTPSKNSNHYHITVSFKHATFDDQTRLLLQACLGSDRKRELLGLMRVLNQDQRPTLFIEKALPGEEAGSIRNELNQP